MIQDRTQIQRDTVYLNSLRYDSVYVSKERKWEYKRALPSRTDSLTPNALTPNPDTVVITKVETEYRYRMLRDTVERVKLEVIRDSIPYEVRIVETKETPRQRTWYESLSIWITTSLLIFLLSLTGFKLSKYLKVLFP